MSPPSSDSITVAARPSSTPSQRPPPSATRYGADAAGGGAAERGSQLRSALHPPEAPAPPKNTSNNADNYQEALQDIANIEKALETPNGIASIPPLILRSVLNQAKAAFQQLANNKTPSLQNILNEVKAIHNAVRSLPTPPLSPPPPRSWAQAVAASPLPSPPRTHPETCEITVRLTSAADRKAIAETPNETIVRKVSQAHPEGKAVVAARKLPSGDVRIFLASEAAKKALLQDQNWTKSIGQSSSAAEQLFQIVVYSIRIGSLDPTKVEDITKLQEQNQTLHPSFRVSRAKWMKSQRNLAQAYASLVLGLPDAQIAD